MADQRGDGSQDDRRSGGGRPGGRRRDGGGSGGGSEGGDRSGGGSKDESKGGSRGGRSGGGAKGGGRSGGGRRGQRADDDRVKQLSGSLANVLRRLPDVERRVLEYRMGLVDGHPRNLTDTARELSLTMHEAREIEQRAFARIREVVPLGQLQKFLDQG